MQRVEGQAADLAEPVKAAEAGFVAGDGEVAVDLVEGRAAAVGDEAVVAGVLDRMGGDDDDG